jgi:Nuclease-related domain
MNNQQKRAGQSTREMAAKRNKKRIWYAIVSVVIVLLIAFVALNPKFLKAGSIASIGLLLVARVFMNYSDALDRRMRKEEKRAVRGAKGEEKVGSILEGLDENHLVIHDLGSPFGNIDHIVISKQNGIFLIETKAHGGKVSAANGQLLVNGHEPEKDFIAQCLNNTYWLRDKIRPIINTEIWIVPVLVFTNAFVERMAPIKGVTIINKKYLLHTLQRPISKAQSLAVWENREKILKTLYASLVSDISR